MRLCGNRRAKALVSLTARNGKIVHFEAYGESKGKKVPKDSIWNIMSMTKPISGAAMMQFYEEGRFKAQRSSFETYPGSGSDESEWATASNANDNGSTNEPFGWLPWLNRSFRCNPGKGRREHRERKSCRPAWNQNGHTVLALRSRAI